jgi:heme/copper-type cytochrome/quinol oxidase subunit 2
MDTLQAYFVILIAILFGVVATILGILINTHRKRRASKPDAMDTLRVLFHQDKKAVIRRN